MSTTRFLVDGLACGNCIAKILDHVRAIAGVRRVSVNLVRGGRSPLDVSSDAVPSTVAIREAVERAGFHLVTASARANG